jgi:hypothetical protein
MISSLWMWKIHFVEQCADDAVALNKSKLVAKQASIGELVAVVVTASGSNLTSCSTGPIKRSSTNKTLWKDVGRNGGNGKTATNGHQIASTRTN